MARMIPPDGLEWGNDRSPAERKVYEALRETLGDGFVVIHGVRWQSVTGRGRPIEGEADFVVMHPSRGFVVLEVKGGRIQRDASTRQWSSIDRHNQRHDIDDPFQQAADNRRQLSKFLKDRLALRTLPFMSGIGVVFPDAVGDKSSLGVLASPEVVAMADDLHSLGAWIEQLLDGIDADDLLRTLPENWVPTLEALISPSVDLPMRLGVVVHATIEASNRLTAEQFSVLDNLARTRRVLVTGSAGTGKTVLALEKARRLAGAGARTLLTCFNRPLADHLERCTADVQGLVVHNFHQLCYQWARRDGFDGPDPDSPEVRDPVREKQLGSAYFDMALPSAFVASLAKHDERFDALVVDEAQDFSRPMQRALLKALRAPRSGYVFAFQDEGQGIFAGRRGWDHTGFMEFHLTKNMRNSRNIHDVVKRLYPADDALPTGPEGSAPEFIPVEDSAGVVQQIEARIRALATTDGIGLSQIAVLTAGRAELVAIAPAGRLGGFRVTQDPWGPAGALYVDRISRFKGLERDVVILTGLGNPPAHNRAEPLLYVGASRARSHLIVIDEPGVIARFNRG